MSEKFDALIGTAKDVIDIARYAIVALNKIKAGDINITGHVTADAVIKYEANYRF